METTTSTTPNSAHRRRTSRLLGGLLAAVLAGSLLQAAPAHAAKRWESLIDMDRGDLQGCRARVDGHWKLRLRLDNRRARHRHLAGASRYRNNVRGPNVRFSTRAGRVSRVKGFQIRLSDEISVGMADRPGEEGGYRVRARSIRQC